MKKIDFQNFPSTTSPVNDTNLNKLQDNIEEVFDGVETMGNIIVDSIRSKNILSNWYVGAIDSTTGALINVTDARRTSYIEVDLTNSSNYMLSGLNIRNCSMIVAAYNSSKQFLGRTGAMIQTGTTSLLITSSIFTSGTPQGTGNVKYLIIILYSPASGYTIDGIISSSSMQLEEGNTATTYAPYQNINGQQIYSTVETKIGTWIDGRTIFRKVITFNPRTDVLETSYQHNISNVKEILPTSSCLIHRINNQFVPASMVYPSSASALLEWSVGWQATSSIINLWTGSSLRGQIDTTTYGAVAILEYTKTSD